MKFLQKTFKNKFVITCLACAAIVALACSSVYAWFLMNKNLSGGGLNTDVTSTGDCTMEIFIDEGAANIVKFPDAEPGKSWNIKIKIYNRSNVVQIADIDMLGIIGAVYAEDGDGKKTLDLNKNLLNVFALKHPGSETFRTFADLVYNRNYFAYVPTVPEFTDNESAVNLRIISGIELPVSSDKDEVVAEVSIQMSFLEKIWNSKGEEIDADMNDFQGQTLKIKQIKISAQPK